MVNYGFFNSLLLKDVGSLFHFYILHLPHKLQMAVTYCNKFVIMRFSRILAPLCPEESDGKKNLSHAQVDVHKWSLHDVWWVQNILQKKLSLWFHQKKNRLRVNRNEVDGELTKSHRCGVLSCCKTAKNENESSQKLSTNEKGQGTSLPPSPCTGVDKPEGLTGLGDRWWEEKNRGDRKDCGRASFAQKECFNKKAAWDNHWTSFTPKALSRFSLDGSSFSQVFPVCQYHHQRALTSRVRKQLLNRTRLFARNIYTRGRYLIFNAPQTLNFPPNCFPLEATGTC